MIYLDNAATSWPKPDAVSAALATFLQTAGANPGRGGHRMAVAAADIVASARASIADVIGAESQDRVVFTLNATDSLNLALRGLLRPGDRVITSSMEHNSVTRPLHALAADGVEVVTLRAESDGWLDPERVADAARGGIAMIAVTHASNVTGAAMPVADFARIARDHDALLLVDGAQTVGAQPVDAVALGIDLLAFPGHKGLLGPTGTGGLYIGPRVDLERFIPLRSGGTGIASEANEQPLALPFRFEAGTVNTLGIAGLLAGVNALGEIGLDQVRAHESRQTAMLVDGLRAISAVHVFPVRDETARAAVVSFTIEGWTPADAGAVLDQAFDIACRTGLHCAPSACDTIGALPGGTIRFSPGPFTTDAEIDTAIHAVAELANSPLR
jgi:cysteine desulfurase / selenocysteine lyase